MGTVLKLMLMFVVRARVWIGGGGTEELPDAPGEVAFQAAECFFA